MTASHLITAEQGERRADEYLRGLGFRILIRNYRCPFGELDIVAEHDGVLHIVEVKTRSQRLDEPMETVRPSKRRRMVRISRRLVEEHHLDHMPCQFDVISVHCDSGGQLRVEFFEDAFPGDSH